MSKVIHRLMVDAKLFTLATRAIREHSLATKRFESINSTICAGARRAERGNFPRDRMEKLSRLGERSGPIRINLSIDEKWAESFHIARRNVELALGHRTSTRQLVAILCSFAATAPELLRSQAIDSHGV